MTSDPIRVPIPTGFPPEMELLIACARARTTDKDDARAARNQVRSMLSGPLQWPRVMALAAHHAMRPLLYQQFERDAFEGVPLEVHQELSTFVRHNLVSTTLLASNLPKVLSVLRTRGVPVLPYKGPALSALLYDNTALREFSDLDLLIHAVDAEPACRALLDAGFTSDPALDERQHAAFLSTATACEFLAPSSVFRVELHWKNFGRAVETFPEEWFWKEKMSVPVGELRIDTIPLITHLLLLCIHGSKHGWSRLSYLCDIAAVLEKYPDLDWAEFWVRAEHCGARRMVALALTLSRDILGAKLPGTLALEQHSSPAVCSLVEKSLLQMMSGAEPGAGYALRLQDTLMGGVRFFLRMGFTPGINEYRMLNLPHGLRFLYSGLRAARMTGMMVRNVF